MTDIVERLRIMANGPREYIGYQSIRDAADEIERLRTEIVRFAEVNRELAAEIERLRQLLRWVMEDYDDTQGAHIAHNTIEKVRFALMEKAGE